MPSTHKSLRSGTAHKRPTTAIADGQIALNTNSTSPGLFFKDSTGATIIKVGPVHVGTTAPNTSPGTGGSSGNSTGEVWLDTSLTPVGVKIWNGSAWVNGTPTGSTSTQGLLELATDVETQTGSDTARAVTPAGLQSKVSDSVSTTSATTIASSTAVKSAYDLANAALPKSGGTVTGNLEIGSTGSLTFEGSTADGFETTLAVVDPTADRTITLPNITGTVVTTGDTGTVTSTMLADGTVVDADISASAEIAVSKLADGAARQLLQTDAAGTGVEWTSNIDIPGTLDVTGAAVFDSSVSITGALTKSGNNVVTVGDTGTVTSTMLLDGTILNADVNASAAIAGTKISPDFGDQNRTSTGTSTAASFIPSSSTTPSNGVFLPAANTVGIASNTSERIRFTGSGEIGIGGANYGSSGQVLMSAGTGAAASWQSLSSYLTTSSAASTYAPLASPTFTGTVTIPAGASISGYLTASTASSTYAPLASPTFTGSIAFPAGQRFPQIPQNSQTSSYTLVATDAGKHISITTGGVTVPSAVLSTGDAVTIFNNSTSSQTVTQGVSATVRLAGTATTGNRTLAQYGVATILCVASNTFVISGAGLS